MLNCGPPSYWLVHSELGIVWPLSHKIGCAQHQCVSKRKEGLHDGLKQALKKQISVLGGFLWPLTFTDLSGRRCGAAVVHFWVVFVYCEVGPFSLSWSAYCRNLPNKALGVGWERGGNTAKMKQGEMAQMCMGLPPSVHDSVGQISSQNTEQWKFGTGNNQRLDCKPNSWHVGSGLVGCLGPQPKD